MRENYKISFLSVTLFAFALALLVLGWSQYYETDRVALPLISFTCALYLLILGMVYI